MKLEINKRENDSFELLVDVPFGKCHLSDLNHPKDQHAQKEGTCWYYTFNRLRERYGKLFSPTNSFRHTELLISTLRKKITKIDTEINFLLQQSNEFSNKTKAREFLHAIRSSQLKIIHNSLSFSSDEIKKILIKFLNKFIAQNKIQTSMDYLAIYKDSLEVKEYETLLKQLNINPEKLVKEFLSTYCYINYENLKTEKAYMYRQSIFIATKIVIAHRYHLKILNWKPSDGFDKLGIELAERGIIRVAVVFGGTFSYANPQPFGKWTLHDWNPSEYRSLRSSSHSIIIIGLQKSMNKQYVIFLDPNFSSTVTGPNMAFRICYDHFLAGLNTIYGISHNKVIERNTAPGPYGYQPNLERLAALNEFYKADRANDTIVDEDTRPRMRP